MWRGTAVQSLVRDLPTSPYTEQVEFIKEGSTEDRKQMSSLNDQNPPLKLIGKWMPEERRVEKKLWREEEGYLAGFSTREVYMYKYKLGERRKVIKGTYLTGLDLPRSGFLEQALFRTWKAGLQIISKNIFNIFLAGWHWDLNFKDSVRLMQKTFPVQIGKPLAKASKIYRDMWIPYFFRLLVGREM